MRDTNDVYVDDVFEKLKNFIKRILRLVFKVFSLIWAKKLIFLALLVVGFVMGYIIDSSTPKEYETVLQVRTLRSGTEYVYNLMDNLNRNLGDSIFLEEIGLHRNELESIEIVPMANMEDLISSFRSDDSKTLETLILNTSTQDLLTSEFFRSQYGQHEIHIKFGSTYNKSTLNNLLDFINDNAYYQQLYRLNQESYKAQIAANEMTLTKIDTLVTNFNSGMSNANSSNSSLNAILNEQRATSIFDLLRFKTELVRDTENLRGNLEQLEAPVTLTNRPVILEQRDFFEKRKFFLPLILAGGFLIVLLLLAFFKKMRSWAQ